MTPLPRLAKTHCVYDGVCRFSLGLDLSLICRDVTSMFVMQVMVNDGHEPFEDKKLNLENLDTFLNDTHTQKTAEKYREQKLKETQSEGGMQLYEHLDVKKPVSPPKKAPPGGTYNGLHPSDVVKHIAFQRDIRFIRYKTTNLRTLLLQNELASQAMNASKWSLLADDQSKCSQLTCMWGNMQSMDAGEWFSSCR